MLHTMPPDSKRRLLYNKQLCPNTFVLFFYRGATGTSWSVRDYSIPGSVELRYAADFRDAGGEIPLASDVLATAEYDFPAHVHRTTDLDYWHTEILAKNQQYLARLASMALPAAAPIPRSGPTRSALSSKLPILNLPKLMALPKAEKRGDIERIRNSGNSEDYVTWNFFQLLESVPATQWWPALLRLTGSNSIDPTDIPAVRLWQTTPAPSAYEKLSRERLRSCENPAWRGRSRNPNPVEGLSEIDIVLEGRSYIAYIEAKLGSDISLKTTYDPERNQILRNIDCLLEDCGNRRPIFWMFVRDRQPERHYMNLMSSYRDANVLSRSLPHRDKARLEEVASGLALVTWSDLLTLVDRFERGGTAAKVHQELVRRVR